MLFYFQSRKRELETVLSAKGMLLSYFHGLNHSSYTRNMHYAGIENAYKKLSDESNAASKEKNLPAGKDVGVVAPAF